MIDKIKTPIKIPLIQRDYVQGRRDQKAKEVRERFLEDLFEGLKSKKSFHLDFIYGIEEEFFIPIDGQQRLTLLYLLHWYFSKKEQVPNSFPSLTYETRIGAREFCNLLPTIDIDFNQKSISSQIQNHKNFIPYWIYDPTVQSMLVVLDLIHTKAQEYPEITFNDLQKISYEIFEMRDFGEVQAEELYRKMNSRGKPLTPFENFKAIIEKNVLTIYGKESEEYKKVVSNFESRWLEPFWDRSCKNVKEIDKGFIHFIYFLSAMRSFELNEFKEISNYITTKEPPSMNSLEKFYQKEKHLNFLIDTLEKLQPFKKLSSNLYHSFKFFEGEKRVSLFEQIIQQKLNIPNAILAYTALFSLPNEEEKVFQILRWVRNDLHTKAVYIKTGKIEYDWSIESKDIPNLLKRYLPLTKSQPPLNNLEHEYQKSQVTIQNPNLKEKIEQLEDLDYIRGDLRLLLELSFLEDDRKKIEFFHNLFIKKELFEQDEELLCRALLSIDNYSLKIGNIDNQYHAGNKFFFGQKGKWELFLTKNRHTKEIKDTLNKFFHSLYQHSNLPLSQALQQLIQSYQPSKKDWRYYFVKYPIILSTIQGYQNIFGWLKLWEEDDKDGNSAFIEKLEKSTKITNHRINVFILALLETLGEKDFSEKIKIDKSGFSYYQDHNLTIRIASDNLIVNSQPFPLFQNQDAIQEAKRSIQ